MKPKLYAMVATFCYAGMNLIFERHLRRYTPSANQLLMYVVPVTMVLLVLATSKLRADTEIVFPSGKMILVGISTGILLYTADFTFLKAFEAGGKAVVLTTILASMPIATMIITSLIDRAWPKPTAVLGALLVLPAVYLVTRP